MADAKATVIWSPRSNFALYGVTAPVSLMKDYGINLALGTDWAYSGSVHILEELKVAADYNAKYLNNIFTAKELWQMTTVNPAKLMQLSDQIGDIRPGMQADLVLFNAENRRFKTDEDIYKAVIGMDSSKTELVMRGGTILYGKWKLLDGVISDIPGDTDEFFGENIISARRLKRGILIRNCWRQIKSADLPPVPGFKEKENADCLSGQSEKPAVSFGADVDGDNFAV